MTLFNILHSNSLLNYTDNDDEEFTSSSPSLPTSTCQPVDSEWPITAIRQDVAMSSHQLRSLEQAIRAPRFQVGVSGGSDHQVSLTGDWHMHEVLRRREPASHSSASHRCHQRPAIPSRTTSWGRGREGSSSAEAIAGPRDSTENCRHLTSRVMNAMRRSGDFHSLAASIQRLVIVNTKAAAAAGRCTSLMD